MLALTVLKAQAQSRSSDFVAVSDIHFNPLADPSLAPKLLTAEPRDWENLFLNDPSSPQQAYNEDATWQLLHSLIAEIAGLQPKPKLIIVAGDILAHKLREKFAAATNSTDSETYRTFIKNTVTFIGLELQKAAGGVPVIYTVGNNDDECGDYALEPNGPFLKDSLKTVAGLSKMNPRKLTTWSSIASYGSENPLARRHRIIALNTTFWSRRYTNACAGNSAETDPGASVLTWLEAELKNAQTHRTKVWLVYHIPPGIDGHASSRTGQVTPMWKANYTEEFNKLLDQYRDTIELNIAAHTHLDDFRLVKTAHTTTLVLLTPGVSPNVGQNPAFRVVTVDTHARPQDVRVYYLAHPGSSQWELEYSARSAFGLKRIDADSYQSLFRNIQLSPDIARKWRLYYSTSRAEALNSSKSYQRSLYCATGYTDPNDFQSCINTP